MTRPTTLPTDRYIYHHAEPTPDQPTSRDHWIVSVDNDMGSSGQEAPLTAVEVLDRLSRWGIVFVVFGIAFVVLSQCGKLRSTAEASEIEPVSVARVQWGAR